MRLERLWVGRVTIPLARRTGEVVGVDVSASMLAEARRNCESQDARNVTLLPSDDRLSALTGSFDFIHSFVVFQHIPRERGEALLVALLEHLAEGGVGALHFTYATRASVPRRIAQSMRARVPLVHNVLNVAQRRPLRFPHMQMVCYDVGCILQRLQDHGCHRVAARFTDHGQHLGVVLLFKKAALPPL